MSTFDEKVCLKVQRAGLTEIFRLRGAVVKFGYAPGGEHDLVLHDSRLEDVQGVIERKDASASAGFTPYHLKASSSGVEVEGVRLPPREAAAIRLKYGQQIKVGRYVLTVEREEASAPAPTLRAGGATGATQGAFAWPIPEPLQAYLATSQLFLNYLPEIYRSNEAGERMAQPFLSRYLALFESVFLPLKWTVENFALWLQPRSAPPEALPWLAGWYGLPVALDSLPPETQRELLVRLPYFLARKGTLAGLCALLALYTGVTPAIQESEGESRFVVTFAPKPQNWETQRAQVIRLINWFKPVHTTFTLE